MTVAKTTQLGLRLRQRGLDAVEEHNLSWVQLMRREAQRICTIHGSVTTDELQEYAKAQQLQPEHPNAWGSVFRGNQWVCIGRRKSRRPSAHAREIRVWALRPNFQSQEQAA